MNALHDYKMRCAAWKQAINTAPGDAHEELNMQKDVAYKHAISVMELVLAVIAVRS